MKTKKIILIVLSILILFALGWFGVSAYNNYQIELQQEEKLKEEEQEKQRIAQEEAQKQAELDNLKSQLRSGNIDPNTKVVFLTFDDGPDETYSNEVLDLLKRNDIKATFFTNGKTGPEYDSIYQRIVNEGHVLANHSYSHDYSLYDNPSTFIEDVLAQEQVIRNATGVEPVKVFRFPGGSNISTTEDISALQALGYNYFDWTASAGDGASIILSPEEITSKILTEVHEHPLAIILCHAENPVKTTTRDALEPVINQLKAEGYTFLTLDPSYQFDRAKFM